MGVFAIEKGAFAGLSAEDQQIVREVMLRYIDDLDREAREDNRKASEVLAKSGLQTVDVNAADVDGWRGTIEALFPKVRERSDIDAPVFDRLLALLTDYRRTHPEPGRQ
jgi:TRAP-type C4-dicarboxylate transport system substrate-binding protein